MSAGMARRICSPEQHYSLASDESTVNLMFVNCIELCFTCADALQIKTVFLITIGIFELG